LVTILSHILWEHQPFLTLEKPLGIEPFDFSLHPSGKTGLMELPEIPQRGEKGEIASQKDPLRPDNFHRHGVDLGAVKKRRSSGIVEYPVGRSSDFGHELIKEKPSPPMSEDDGYLGDGYKELVDALKALEALARVFMADRFVGMEKKRNSPSGKGFYQSGQAPDVRGRDIPSIESQFTNAPYSRGDGSLQFFFSLAERGQRKASKRKKTAGMLVAAVQEIVISLPAESRVLPRKSTDHALVDSLSVHGLQEVFRAGHFSLGVSINQAKPFIPVAKKGAVLPDFLGKQMGVGIDDHRDLGPPEESNRIAPRDFLKSNRRPVEEIRGM
jgi:hypothetical protein